MSADFVKEALRRANASAAYDPNDPLAPVYANLVALYADKKVFAGTVRDNSTLIEAFLRAKRILYWKNTPGDCASQTKISPSMLQTGAKTGLAAAATLTSLASAGVFGGAAGASGLAAEVSSVAVSGAFAAATAGIGLALVPVFMIIQHHKQAVATEQATLCEVTGFFNDGYQAIVNANVDWKTKKDYFNQVATQALSAADKAKNLGGACNAGCMIENGIKALRDLYIMLYATPPSSAIIQSPTQSQGAGPTPTNSQGGAIVADVGKSALVAGAGAWIAHTAGAF